MPLSNTERSLFEKFKSEGSAKRMLRKLPDGKPRVSRAIFNKNHMNRMQWMAMMTPLLVDDPSYATPIFQAAMAAPLVYEEILADKYALAKLKKMGIGKAEIQAARKSMLKGFGPYLKLMALPLLGAMAVRHFKKPKPDTSKGYVLRKGVSFKQ